MKNVIKQSKVFIYIQSEECVQELRFKDKTGMKHLIHFGSVKCAFITGEDGSKSDLIDIFYTKPYRCVFVHSLHVLCCF